MACLSRREKGKKPRKIRYISYQEWALKLMQFHKKTTLPNYEYPKVVLQYIRALEPDDVKGDIIDDCYKVSLTEFCQSLDIKLF